MLLVAPLQLLAPVLLLLLLVVLSISLLHFSTLSHLSNPLLPSYDTSKRCAGMKRLATPKACCSASWRSARLPTAGGGGGGGRGSAGGGGGSG